ncbi:MAG: hypothetical protein GY799_25265 [Desulfobulbaceae bacterium]|nr:hypothetical protein [Desulfobulbaceae bacterium]
MTNIIDIIRCRCAPPYTEQHFIVVDELPDFRFAEKFVGGRRMLTAKDGYLSRAYVYERPGKNWRAFGGRKFDIPMMDGSVKKAAGQWWDVRHHDGSVGIGVNTITGLEQCYVFRAYSIDKDVEEQMYKRSSISNNYYKYDKGHPDYGKHIIKVLP